MPATPSTRTPSAERRVAPRRQPAIGTVCRLSAAGGKNFGMGLVWNISTSGVSMLMHEQVEPGMTMRVDLVTQDESFALPRQVRVAHVAGLRTGDYIMGAQFLQPLTAEEMQHFVV